VRIEVSGEELPPGDHEVDELRGRLIEAAESWARRCAADRRIEIADA
jgi:hypothetical protein